jgi:chitodextrinase
LTWRRRSAFVAALAAVSFIPLVGGAALSLAATGSATADEPILLAAGDIAGCDSNGDEETAAILDGQAGTIAALGDLAYENGTAAEFSSCYGPSWGRHRDRTYPAPGNHEYLSSGAAPYYAYFGDRAGPSAPGYYSYDLGAWHIVSLNSNCSSISGGCGPGSPQEAWLRADLAASSALCTLAYWHHASFSSGTTHGPSDRMRALLDLLHAHHADVLLTGHEHHYERFAPQTPDRIASSSGIRAFVVGTGGRSPTYPFGTPPAPNSELRVSAVRGVLKLTLRAAGYDWQFLPVAGQTLADAGTGSCHGAPPPDSTAPTAPSGLTASSPSGSRVELGWTAASDNVGVAGYRIFRNNVEVGTTSATAWMDATATPATTYTYHVVAYDAALNDSPPSNTATITTRSADRTLTFVPSADATIESANPTRNLGTATTLQADASPVRAFVVKFNVSGVGSASVVEAKLRLHVTNPSNRGGDLRATAAGWNEATVNWQNAPAGGAVVGSLLRVLQGSWYEISLPAGAISGDGDVAFRVDSPSTDGVDYVSREGSAALRPELVVTVSDPVANDLEAPTKPTGLTATPTPSGAVDLVWNASSDNLRVAGYRILRDGTEIITTSATASTDTSVAPGTRYAYQVVAYDGAGNASEPSDTVFVTTATPPPPPPPPPGPRTLTFTPSADATIVSGTPSRNFGTTSMLEADNSPVKGFLIRFDVGGVGPATVTSARLRLHVTNASDRGGDFRATANGWTENAVTWATAPAAGALVASLGTVAAGSWQEFELAGGAVTGDGAFSFRVASPSSDGAAYDSREAGAALAPQLILTVVDPTAPDTSPPTAPTGLGASAVSASRVDLSWTAATDNTRVTGYRVLRDGVELATTAETAYVDNTVAASTSYAYQVVAYDPSGNVSPPSNTANATTPAAPPPDRTLTFTPTDDSYVLRDTPTSNHGAAPDLQVDNSPVKAFLLKFNVSGVGGGTVTSAKVRLHVTNPSNGGGDFSSSAASWAESTVTWATAPTPGARVGTLGTVALGSWQEVPLAAAAVTGDGVVSIRVDSTSSDGAAYDAKEASATLAPQLVLTVSGWPSLAWLAYQ